MSLQGSKYYGGLGNAVKLGPQTTHVEHVIEVINNIIGSEHFDLDKDNCREDIVNALKPLQGHNYIATSIQK